MTSTAVRDPNEKVSRLTAVAQGALKRWAGTFDEISLVKYRENAVFRVRDSRGRRFALRVHRPGYHTDAELLSELQWMSALADSGVGVPAIIPAQDGDLLVKAEDPSFADPLQVDMLAWFEGEPVGSIETGFQRSADELRELYRQIGEIAATLHNHATRWKLPSGFARHSWDSPGILGPKPFWGDFRELPALVPHLPLIEDACKQATVDLDRLGKAPRNYSLIHADLVPENILRNGSGMMLIDFDDAGFGWHMFELATALFFHSDEPCYQTIQEGLFTGYDAVRSLPDQYLNQLKLFMFLRSLTYLGWVWTRHDTDTARELTPMFVDKAVGCAGDLLG